MSNYNFLDSSFTGPYYHWFCELGYPQCDLHLFPNGEWAILEMLNAPNVPSLTQWRWIAKGFKNVEPQKSRVARILDEINPQKRIIWEREEAKTRELESAQKSREDRVQDIAEEWSKSVARNADLTERIAKNGMQEILPHNIAKHIPESKLK